VEPPAGAAPGRRFALPNLRRKLPADLAQEYDEALGDVSLEELMAADHEATRQGVIEPDSRQTGRVVHVSREDVFVELGGREQGIAPLRQFVQPPEPGMAVEVVVNRYNAEEGLYELSLPEMAADVEDWSDLSEGMLVEARVTGHNSGGLECEVNHIRGFIPISQIALYRVEGLEEFVDQKFTCLVTEANPARRNLVLSRRAVLEREREEARKELFDSLQPGQIREGVVRKLMDFGAFVELGSGVDGLLHVSQLGWARVEHPREVLHEGQTLQVKIEKVDKETGRISLGYRDLLENPWTHAATKYPANTLVRGRVTKLMEFGAFVEVEPGVEGLVHISELSHKRVWRTSDVVHECDEVEVLVLSVDAEAQRMSLSMKQALPEPEPAKKEESEPGEPAPPPKKLRRKPGQPLKGGLGGPTGGERFGLRW
jgi:small subunit ribosomal protein S1